MNELINYQEAVKRWCKHVDDYNDACPRTEYTRTLKRADGTTTTQKYTRAVEPITAAVKATGMHLIKLYADAWRRNFQVCHGMARPDDVYVATSRAELSERLSRSERSCYDHLDRLKTAGLVDKYQFCGRQHNFRLWISPKILWGAATEPSQESALEAQKPLLGLAVRQNLPLSYTSQKQYSTTIRAVGGGQTQKLEHGNNKDPHSLAQKANELASSVPSTETRAGGGAAAATDESAVGWKKLPENLKHLVLQFWLMARTTLYPMRQWSNEENMRAVMEIYGGIFGRFEVAQTDTAWNEYYSELTDRLKMARTWFDKNAHRRPDMPYRCGKKMGYFDPLNNFGFAITAQWLGKDKLRKRTNRVEYLLNQARIDFEKLAAGKPRPSHQDKSELQLFVYYQNVAKSYGHDVEERFCEQYLRQKARKFAPQKPQRLTIRAQKAADKAAEVVYVEPWMEMGEYYYSQ